MELSKRLLAAAELVKPESFVADIGCDHGKLSAWLILNNKCKKVEAGDLRQGPLARARELFADLSIENRAFAVLSDGFDNISHDIDAAVLAGIGADTLIHILEKAPFIKEKQVQLILVPSSRHEKLRKYLCSAGFQIESERAVAECGHLYTVMSAVYCGKKSEIDCIFAETGLIGRGELDTDGRKYLETVLARCKKTIKGEEKSSSPNAERIKTLNEITDFIERKLDK